MPGVNSEEPVSLRSRFARMRARTDLKRCPRCHRFLEPDNVVCGDCGLANVRRVRDRARRRMVFPEGCPHYFIAAPRGEICIYCGVEDEGGMVPRSEQFRTRKRPFCECCGAPLEGRKYCTCCGARIDRFAKKPPFGDIILRRFSRSVTYTQDEEQVGDRPSWGPLKEGAFLVALIALIETLVILGLYLGIYVWSVKPMLQGVDRAYSTSIAGDVLELRLLVSERSLASDSARRAKLTEEISLTLRRIADERVSYEAAKAEARSSANPTIAIVILLTPIPVAAATVLVFYSTRTMTRRKKALKPM